MRSLPAAWLLLSLGSITGCRAAPARIDIVATNYAFTAPATAPAGPTLFRLVNHGTVPHEVQLFRFAHHTRADSAMHQLMDSTAADSLWDPSGSVLTAQAGQVPPEAIFADLKRGETWALLCNFRDSVAAPRHFKMGMVAILEVE
jgi:hypothetical protein